eukprot:4053781-Amphidinium_carterae.1
MSLGIKDGMLYISCDQCWLLRRALWVAYALPGDGKAIDVQWWRSQLVLDPMQWREHPLDPRDGAPCVMAARIAMDDDDEVHITSEHDRSSDEFSHALSELALYYEKTPAKLAYTRSNVWTEGTRPRS